MSSKPSSALRELIAALPLGEESTVTVGMLREVLETAAQAQEQSEYEDYMGEDL